jgi:hypothetical protein
VIGCGDILEHIVIIMHGHRHSACQCGSDRWWNLFQQWWKSCVKLLTGCPFCVTSKSWLSWETAEGRMKVTKGFLSIKLWVHCPCELHRSATLDRESTGKCQNRSTLFEKSQTKRKFNFSWNWSKWDSQSNAIISERMKTMNLRMEITSKRSAWVVRTTKSDEFSRPWSRVNDS